MTASRLSSGTVTGDAGRAHHAARAHPADEILIFDLCSDPVVCVWLRSEFGQPLTRSASDFSEARYGLSSLTEVTTAADRGLDLELVSTVERPKCRHDAKKHAKSNEPGLRSLRSISRSFIRFPRTTCGGSLGSPSGRTSLGRDGSTRGTINLTFQVNSASTIFGFRKHGKPKRYRSRVRCLSILLLALLVRGRSAPARATLR